MYLRILKKDLKRKKTMNVILLIFIILAAMFIASGTNNMLTVTNALDSFFEKADVPDYWLALTDKKDFESFEEFAKKNDYSYKVSRMIQVAAKDAKIGDEKFVYDNMLGLSSIGDIKIFDKDNGEISEITDGEIYVSAEIFDSVYNDFHEGSKIRIKLGDKEREFTLKGYVKDALMGSAMIGMTRFFISENDLKFFDGENVSVYELVNVYTDDTEYSDKFNEMGINTTMLVDNSIIKKMYLMDMLIAAIMLVVSVCLILISMVILRFIINFTITEEFREIGVMKAIGIRNSCIRGLYIAKYLAISVVGTVVGLGLSFPFGKLLMEKVSRKIVISGEDNFLINIIAAALVAVIVVFFCYLCTRKIRIFSPIDAIRNGETGERYLRKGFIHLSKSKLAAVPFMAVNDILSGLKKYISMIIIFILGTLLIVIPVNTINTLRSDGLISMFNMTKSDHVISQELLLSDNADNEKKIKDGLNEVKSFLLENEIEADVFQEIFFRSNISKGDKKANSMSFLGIGGVTTDMYTYIEGTAPQNENEVALSYILADKIDAKIGDDVEIKTGEKTKTYTVTAINQSMNNLGEGIRFYQDEEFDWNYVIGSFGIQINYKDAPDDDALSVRKSLLEKHYADADIYNSGEYISYMIGNVAEQLESIKTLILIIILCINILVVVLMVKSFITKEKSEIALLKAVGFNNKSLTMWQAIRIGIVLIISVILGVLLSMPLLPLIITPIFKIMGAYSIEYAIRPLEVYVMYPLILFAVTVLAAFISAQSLRRISSSEISNIE